MGIIELLLLSVGLGMDAFAVSVCKGISMKKMDWKKAIIIGRNEESIGRKEIFGNVYPDNVAVFHVGFRPRNP